MIENLGTIELGTTAAALQGSDLGTRDPRETTSQCILLVITWRRG